MQHQRGERIHCSKTEPIDSSFFIPHRAAKGVIFDEGVIVMCFF